MASGPSDEELNAVVDRFILAEAALKKFSSAAEELKSATEIVEEVRAENAEALTAARKALREAVVALDGLSIEMRSIGSGLEAGARVLAEVRPAELHESLRTVESQVRRLTIAVYGIGIVGCILGVVGIFH